MKTSLNCEEANFTERWKIWWLCLKRNIFLTTFFPRYLVKFGENYHSGCSIQVSQSDIAEHCDQIKNNIIGILVGIGKEEMNSISKHKSGILNISVYINIQYQKTFIKSTKSYFALLSV